MIRAGNQELAGTKLFGSVNIALQGSDPIASLNLMAMAYQKPPLTSTRKHFLCPLTPSLPFSPLYFHLSFPPISLVLSLLFPPFFFTRPSFSLSFLFSPFFLPPSPLLVYLLFSLFLLLFLPLFLPLPFSLHLLFFFCLRTLEESKLSMRCVGKKEKIKKEDK